MAEQDETGSVDLAGGGSATHHLHRVLSGVSERFPDVFAGPAIDAREFRRNYPEILPRFECARAASPRRAEIASALAEAGRSAVVWHDGDGEHDLTEHVAHAATPFELASSPRAADGRLRPAVPFDGRQLAGAELVAEVRRLVERGSASPDVATAIEWIVELAGDDGIDLSDRRIVVLGAAAELAPTRMWLAGGADVLWVDVTDPPADLVDADHPGSLRWVPGGADLLVDPARIRSTIEHFAADDAVDLGLYAYAAGRAREWRLAAAMNSIVDALPAGTVRGVAMLVSPTTCGLLSESDLAGEHRRREERPRWQSVLTRLGALGDGAGHLGSGSSCVKRAIVSIQGGSYQAAQYLGKLIAAEVWASGDSPIEVSANTAGVSLTESLRHPVFDTAFAGAAAFGVETFEPATTAHLNGLLTLRDRLAPKPAGTLDDLFATRVHGGVYELPFPIEPALRVAAALGVAKDPRRLGSLLRRR